MIAWPHELEGLLCPRDVEEVHLGLSDDRVCRVVCGDGSVCYVKEAWGERIAELQHEHAIAVWLQGESAPKVRFFGVYPSRAVLCTDAVPGFPASDVVLDVSPERLMEILAQAVRDLHERSTVGCPTRHSLRQNIAEAKRRVRLGLVDLEGKALESVLSELDGGLELSEERVVVHGDCCLPNLMVHQGCVAGMVDWGRAGVADRYQDIALLLRSFRRNTGVCPEDIFCAHYGLSTLHREKIAFYTLLDSCL